MPLPPRSLLYVPAHRADLWSKAGRTAADALILDLEDGTPLARRAEATGIVDTLVHDFSGRAQVCVRIACDHDGLDLLRRLSCLPRVSHVMLAKAERPDDLLEVAEVLHRAGSPAALVPIIESAIGLQKVSDLADSARVCRIQLGEADLRASLRIPTSTHIDLALLAARSTIVTTSAASGLHRPTGSVSTQYRDLTALRTDSAMLRDLGFFGRTCIHPAQVAVVNEVFTPSPDEVASARAMLEGAPTGGGAHVGPDGSMVDEAVLRSAREVLAAASAYP